MKNFENIAQLLEDANLKQAAVVLRQELKQGKARVKKQLDLSGRSNKSSNSNISQRAPVNVKCQVKSTDVMDQLMNKIISKKRMDNVQEKDHIARFQKTQVYQNLIKKQTVKKTNSIPQGDQFSEKQPKPQRENQAKKQQIFETEKSEDSFDLPHFGQTGNISNERQQAPSSSMVMVEDELMQAETIETPPSQPMPSMIIKSQEDSSFIESHSLLGDLGEVDEYEDDDDPGFYSFSATEDNINEISSQLAQKYGFPQRACQPKKPEDPRSGDESSELVITQPKSSLLPGHVQHPNSHDDYYPVEFEGIVYDCMNIKIIYDREKTGFEETKDFQIVINSVIAGRYQVIEYLGSAAFSKAVQALDLLTNQPVCIKIIENNKDYLDQSIDEIKLLRYINLNVDAEQKNLLRLIDFFYHKEHLFIVTELLRDNLYEFSRYNRENEEEVYFTVGKLQKVCFQILTALQTIQSMHLIHCDLKPENILIKSYSRCEIKVIDFGSSCFIHDHLSSYVQSRSYRAPEVILGCKYDYKIDIWSLGCIIAELFTGNVLFQNDSIQGLLSRVIGICGPLPEDMFQNGRLISNYFTKDRLLFQEVNENLSTDHLTQEMVELVKKKKKKKIQILVPKKTSLKARLRTKDPQFLDFVTWLLQIDRERRPSATEALNHPWIKECKYPDGL